MAKDNRFFDRADASYSQDVDKNKILLNILRKEFPDDYLIQRGQLKHDAEVETDKAIDAPKPITKATRSADGIMRMTAERTEYVEITAMKSVPTVDEEELDEILDEEYEFFVDPESPPTPLPVTGEFFMKPLSPLNPVDMHDLYIRFGPATIATREGTSDEVVEDTFCVYYIQNGVALPIPNYKTLEVMLVERGLTYSAIKEATADDILNYDMELDGNFAGDPTTEQPADPIEEFNFRRMSDRSFQWTERIRFESGYTPTAPFKRDPGDYLKPSRLGRKDPQDRADADDKYIAEDPDDFYYDRVFQGQTYKEKYRENYEGRMVIAKWPTGDDFDTDIVSNFSTQRFDDLSRDLRLMTLGYWKQVVDTDTMAIYAALNNIDISGKRNTTGDASNEFIVDQFIQEEGILNQLIVNGGVDVLQEEVEDREDVPIWNDFPHIAEVDALDRLEYTDYVDNYSSPFDIEYLQPYEPIGSIKYYNEIRVLELQEQAQAQAILTEVKEALEELALTVSPKITELTQIISVSDDVDGGYVESELGQGADIYRILEMNGSGLDNEFRWRKRKNNGKIKNKKSSKNFMKVAGKQRVYRQLNNKDKAEAQSDGLAKRFYLNSAGNDKEYSNARLPELVRSGEYRGEKVAASFNDIKSRAVQVAKDIDFARETLEELNELIVDIDEILLDSTDPTEVKNAYDALVRLISNIDEVNDVVTRASRVKSDVEKVKRQYVKKVYQFVQSFRRAVYENNNKYFIQWPKNARNLVNAYVPGKKFNDFLPDGVE